ncbi:unnamed protein product [Linum tenue]|uniref:Mitochondrial glycoprotein family protein n=1 Tax=Linum tenue TaxID=586396 RepID=A0AAV0JNW9_9ROSI|nr:unnamed protein product [Linum tenue]
MAFRAVIRKSASTLAPLVGRAVSRVEARRSFGSAILTAAGGRRGCICGRGHAGVSHLCGYSTAPVVSNKPAAGESLLRIIEDEIKTSQETDDHDQVEDVPAGFPFEIEDKLGQQTLTLTRQYEGEHVKVEVHMPDLVTGEENDVRDDDDDDDTERPTQSSLPLVVTVTKKSGTSLEFSCVAFADEIAIDSLSVKKPENNSEEMVYDGPNFHDLDENLKNAFHKYLDIRGIKPSTTNFLHEYMINKDCREYLGWLNDLRKFVQA